MPAGDVSAFISVEGVYEAGRGDYVVLHRCRRGGLGGLGAALAIAAVIVEHEDWISLTR